MNARTAHFLRPVPLLVLLVAGLLLFLSRPAAQTNNDFPIQFVLRDAKIVADLIGSPAFVVGDEAVDGDALIRFYNLRNSRLAWSGTPRTLADAATAIRTLSRADEHGLDRYHLVKLADSNATLSKEDAAIHDLLLTDAILKYARELRIGTPHAADRDTDLPAQEFDAVSSLNSALEGGTLAEFLADLAPPHTPGKRAFARPERTLSHGCVRVEQILPLASIALSGDTMAAAETPTGAVTSGETQYLALEQPLPMYVLYWTAIGNGDGTAQFRRDGYGRDTRLLHALRAARTASTAFFTGDCRRSAG